MAEPAKVLVQVSIGAGVEASQIVRAIRQLRSEITRSEDGDQHHSN
jgi:hypothetical protein